MVVRQVVAFHWGDLVHGAEDRNGLIITLGEGKESATPHVTVPNRSVRGCVQIGNQLLDSTKSFHVSSLNLLMYGFGSSTAIRCASQVAVLYLWQLGQIPLRLPTASLPKQLRGT